MTCVRTGVDDGHGTHYINHMAKRINGQFDDHDRDYKVERLEAGPGWLQSWRVEHTNQTLKNAELLRARWERDVYEARVRHQSEY
jgi:hypothetical protein